MDFSPALTVSVIVPIHDSAATLAACLEALRGAEIDAMEIIVADDRSRDEGPEIAQRLGANVIRSAGPGPAAARNSGAREARGKILLFVDSDVVVRPDTVEKIVVALEQRPQLAAIFGSYDDDPTAPGFFSQYKNLLHHFIHQTSRADANTFWAGCGAIRKEVFEQAGGFAQKHYRDSSIEDIELGARLREAGHAIALDRTLCVKHLKGWTLTSLLRSDISRRAKPWSELILARSGLPDELNVKISHRWSAALMWFSAGLAVGAWRSAVLAALLFLSLSAVALLDRKLIAFFAARRGVLFAAGAFAWHCFYYLYSSATFAWCWLRFRLARVPERQPQMEEVAVPVAAE